MPLSAQSFLVCLIFTTSLTHGAVFTDQQEEDLVNFTESLRQCASYVGMTVAVVKGNDTWTRGFGKANRETGEAVSSSHLFGIGSLTKSFAAALLAILLNDTGRYSWDTRVVDILGNDFKFINDQLTHNVTLKDLLSHRTGLFSAELPIAVDVGSNMTRADMAHGIRYLPAVKTFRQEFVYNNYMYPLASYVTELLGNATWEDLLQDRLLQPLGMSSTGVTGQTVNISDDNYAKPYDLLGEQTVLTDFSIYSLYPFDAAVTVASSADDMAKWLMMFVNKGWSKVGGQVINQTLMNDLTTAYMTLPEKWQTHFGLTNPPFPVTFTTDGYAYGWMTGSYRGHPLIWHSGNVAAYSTYQVVLTDQNVGIFVGNNGPHIGRANTALFYYIADILLGEEHWLSVSTACQYPAPWRNKTSSTQSNTVYNETEFQDPEHFAGHYWHPLFGSVHVMRNGSNALNARYGILKGTLLRGQEDNTTMWEVHGKLEFLYRRGKNTKYVQLIFSNFSNENAFQNLKLISSSTVLEFARSG